jgi:glycerophosphoryl diester phosphodiesterase
LTGESLDVGKRVLAGIARCWRPLLAIHVTVTVVALTAIVPLTTLVLRALVATSGRAALADQDLAHFVLTPIGLATLACAAAILLGLGALEQAAFMVVGYGELQGWGVGPMQAIVFVVRRLLRVLRLCLRIVVAVAIIAAPFVAVAALIARAVLGDFDVNYYLARRPPAFWAAAGLIGALGLVAAVLIARRLAMWALALPVLLFLDRNSDASLKVSAASTAGRRLRVVTLILMWGLLVVVLEAVVLALLNVVSSVAVSAASASLAAAVAVLAVMAILAIVVVTCLGAFQSATLALLLLALFDRWSPELREQVGAVAEVCQEPVAPGARRAIVLGACLVAGLAALTAWSALAALRLQDRVEIIAHRGAAGRAPENTLVAVRRAIDDGTDWIEIDVQETADGAVIVTHDSDFMQLAGVPLKVWDGSLERIRQIDVGRWFSPEFAGERVPTLAEVLASARGRARVVIELKYYGHNQALERRVVDIVEAAGMGDRIAIMSLDFRGVQKLRRLRPQWMTGLLMARGVGDFTRLDVDFLAVNRAMVSGRLVRAVHAAGKRIYVWTVNDPVTLSSLMSAGVDGVITDEPGVGREVLEARLRMNPAERLLLRAADTFHWLAPPRAYRDESP